MSESSAPSLDVARAAPPAPPRPHLTTLLAFGVRLARKGITPVFAIASAVVTVLLAWALASKLAAGGRPHAPLHDVPLLASSALAWGGGFLLAFGSALRALRRDHEDGIRHLLVARVNYRGYLFARIAGLACLLALVVAGGTLLVDLVVLVLVDASAFARTLRTAVASFVYASAFSFVFAPVAYAILGVRARGGGYVAFLLVVLVPAMLVDLLAGRIPESLRELLALPIALDTLRDALAQRSVDVLRALRAIAALAVFAALALWVVDRESSRVERLEHTGGAT